MSRLAVFKSLRTGRLLGSLKIISNYLESCLRLQLNLGVIFVNDESFDAKCGLNHCTVKTCHGNLGHS